MKALLLAAVLVSAPAVAQTPPGLVIKTTGLDLRSPDGVKELENRITFRLRQHCGDIHRYSFFNPKLGSAGADYAACLDQFAVADQRPEVQSALVGAKARLGLK